MKTLVHHKIGVTSSLKGRSLRILHVIRSVNPQAGGPIEGLKQLARENIGKGHTVHVVSLDGPSDPWVAACPVNCFAVGPCRWKYGYCPRLVTWLRKHHLEYDAVIVNGIWQYHSFAAWRVLKDQPTPYFVYTHGMLDPYFKRRYPLKHLKKWLYWPWAEYRVLRDATSVLFTCEEEMRLAKQSFWLYKANAVVVNYGVAPPPEEKEAQRAAFLATFPTLRDKRVLLSLGRVHPKKGLELTIRAFGELCKAVKVRGQEAHLVIAGPETQPYADQLREIIAELGIGDQVTFTGMLLGQAKWGAFRASDAFILNSYQENFGIAVVEAMACGLPVLISDQVNIWREIHRDGAGIAKPATLNGARALIIRWLDLSDIERQGFAEAAIKSFAERFNAESAAISLVQATERGQTMREATTT